MKSITKKYRIHAVKKKVWEALTDVKLIEQWSGSRCKMSDVEGSSFELWDGDIWGKNIHVLKEKKIVQEWYAGKWKEPSIVTFELSEEGSNTHLTVIHTSIPEKEVEAIDSGWDDYYLSPLKAVVEGI